MTEPDYTCEICKRKYSGQSSLEKHKNTGICSSKINHN